MESWKDACSASVTGKARRTIKGRSGCTINIYVEPRPHTKKGYQLYALKGRKKVRLAPEHNIHPDKCNDWLPARYQSQLASA